MPDHHSSLATFHMHRHLVGLGDSLAQTQCQRPTAITNTTKRIPDHIWSLPCMCMYPGTNRRSRRRYDARACLSCRFILDPEPHPGDKQKRTRTLTPKLLRTPSLLHGRFVRRSKLRVLLSDLFHTEDRASAWPGPLPSLCSPASNTRCPIRNPLTRGRLWQHHHQILAIISITG